MNARRLRGSAGAMLPETDRQRRPPGPLGQRPRHPGPDHRAERNAVRSRASRELRPMLKRWS